MFSQSVTQLAARIVEAAVRKKLQVTFAESCTGGLAAAALTEIPGASECFPGGFVTYSDLLKSRLLGVSEQTLNRFGAVSAESAREMAAGALKAAIADVAVAVTGIAGPSGGSAEKPVGLVHFAAARRVDKAIATRHHAETFPGPGRAAIRLAAVEFALALLLAEIEAA